MAAAAFALAASKHRVEGIVVEVDRAQGLMVVSHRAIPGFMPAMVMPFRADPPSQMDGLKPGARIVFELVTGRESSKARNVKVVDPNAGGDFRIPAPANQLAIGAEAPDFSLIDHSGRQVRLSTFRGKTVVVNFVYTRCPLPDVCPRLAAHFAYLHRKLGSRVQLLTITLDPTYDTAPVLNDYARRWKAEPDSWRFLTGDENAIRETGGLFGVVFWPDEGAITHTSATAILGADGRLKAVVEGSRYRPEQLLDLVSRYMDPGLR